MPPRTCPVCGKPVRGRQIYDAPKCRTAAYRLRQPGRPTLEAELRSYERELKQARELVAHTVYECAECGTRHLGKQRCPGCGKFSEKLGYGGQCPDDSEAIHLFRELEGAETR